MKNQVTIVMYHYVRPLPTKGSPNLRALEFGLFKKQLDYLSANFNFVTPWDLEKCIGGGDALPERAALVSFDDGFCDHHQFVLPELVRRNVSGIFFPPISAVSGGIVLNVHKIQFILASGVAANLLIKELEERLLAMAHREGILAIEKYRELYWQANRWDDVSVSYLKSMLQKGITEPLRTETINHLFEKFVTDDEADFAGQLYMNLSQLRELRDARMLIGGHSMSHPWLNTLEKAEQEDEIGENLEFLVQNQLLDLSADPFVFCYPFNGYDKQTLEILRTMGCSYGLTAHPRVADLDTDDPLELPRLDTNHLPTEN